MLRRIAPVIASPEASFAERRAARLASGADVAADYRLALRLAAATGSGVFVPMGFEYATRRSVRRRAERAGRFRRARDEAPADPTADVAAANALVDRIAEYRVDGEMRQLTGSQDVVTALLRCDAADPRNASRAVMILANPDIARVVPVGCRFRRCRRRPVRRWRWRRCVKMRMRRWPLARCGCLPTRRRDR